jgi:hypothetical protein
MLWLRVQLESFPVPTRAAFSRRDGTVELEKLKFLLFFLPPPPAALDGDGMNSLMMKPASSMEGVVFLRQGLVLEGLLTVVPNVTELQFGADPPVVVARPDSDSSLRSRRDSS